MRSYTYSSGSWQVCKDTLPPTAYQNWEGYTASKPYIDALAQLGFSDGRSQKLLSKLGQVDVYSRDHAKMDMVRKKQEPFDFLCVLHMNRSYIRVWIEDLPTLIQFFHEIDVQKEGELAEDMSHFLTHSSLTDALMHLASVLSNLENGDIEITVKSPKPPVRRS